ncbi:MAG TPA: hypothetical protein VFS65_00990, partial [Candidatus Saccharimonadales bacterium]|nr:hypothetical protein [Candidatus Saccharimonadales bacterium]
MALRTSEDEDTRLNPGQADADRKFSSGTARSLNQSEQEALGDIENNFDKNADSTQEDSNIKKLQEKESDGAGWNNNFTGALSRSSRSGGRFSFVKKKGPMATIIALVLGGGGIFSIMFAPGIGIVQLKEIMTNDLNDQLTAMDVRTDHVLKAKLSKTQALGSVCSNIINIRCKFGTMTKRQVEKFRKAGFTIDQVEDSALGRQRIISMTAPDGTKINNPQDLVNARKKPAIRSALNKVYNPKFAGLSDAVSKRVFTKFKTNKTKKITGNTLEERNKAFIASTAGVSVDASGIQTDEKGRYILDTDGTKVHDTGETKDRFNTLSEKNSQIDTKAENVKSTGVKAVSGVLSSGLKGVSIIGAADTACTVYNSARAVAAAAKVARSLQLFQYAMVVFNTADAIKAGDATPEEVEYIGNMLTATDNRETIVDETSSIESVSSSGTEATLEKNPFYGKSAFDSPGYSVAAYNDAPTLTSRSQQYMIGGGLSGTLSVVMDDISNSLGGRSGIRDTCGVIQNWWVRGVGLVVGIAGAIGSFGATTVVSVGASLAIGFALPFLESALADIVAGQVVNADTKGVDAGDAVFAGSGAIFGSMAQARGMKPLNKSEIESYLALSNEVKSDDIAAAVYEAQDTPFDIYNQYSFLGSMVRTINPTVIKSSASVSGALSSIPSLLSSVFLGVIPQVNADEQFNEERFSKCNDEGYESLNIDADIFCNVRYGLSTTELNMDTEEVLNYMINNNHINSQTGDAKSDAYKNFLTNCVNREDGWGETSQEGGDTGEDCMKNDGPTMNFRVYTMDKSISDGMDDEEESEQQSTTARPDNVIDSHEGWTLKPGTDYSNVSCDPRTEDKGVVAAAGGS